jgi:hypothetical protein
MKRILLSLLAVILLGTAAQAGSIIPAGVPHAPTFTYLTSGSGTYTAPAGVQALHVRMVGGGGGGGATTTNNGGDGADTVFGAVSAAGGDGGPTSATDSVSCDKAGIGDADIRTPGECGSAYLWSGGDGGRSPFGGAGKGGTRTEVPAHDAAANSGSGGGGASNTSTTASGARGGMAGEYVEFTVSHPAASYSYTVGAGGAGGAAGTRAGGNGGSGVIIVQELY